MSTRTARLTIRLLPAGREALRARAARWGMSEAMVARHMLDYADAMFGDADTAMPFEKAER